MRVQGTTTKIFSFAGDIALLVITEIQLEEALNVTKTVFNNYNMKINIEKTAVIACRTKSGKKRLEIKMSNEKVGNISEFCYLRSKITRNDRCNADVLSRIRQAKKAFAMLRQLLVSNIQRVPPLVCQPVIGGRK